MKVAIIGSGNIGTDLMIKMMRTSEHLEVAALVGIDPASDGLAGARRLGVAAIDTGVDGLIADPEFPQVSIVFDATTAAAHMRNAARLSGTHVRLVDLTPAAIGPYVIPPVNIDAHLGARNVNMVRRSKPSAVPSKAQSVIACLRVPR